MGDSIINAGVFVPEFLRMFYSTYILIVVELYSDFLADDEERSLFTPLLSSFAWEIN
jgi:hypothetical protein